MWGVFVSWMNVTANQLRMSGGGAPSFENTKSLIFDGVDDKLILGSQFTLSGEFTISMWVKPISTWSLQFVGGDDSNTGFIWLISTTQIDLKLNGGNTSVIESGGNDLALGVWQHLFITRDSSNNITVYRNGATFGSSFVDSDDWNFEFFGTGWQWGGWEFTGNIDEIAYWNTEESVSAIYNSGTPNDLTSLNPVGWYRMGDGDTYPTITDHGSAGIDGTMTNMSSSDIVTDVP